MKHLLTVLILCSLGLLHSCTDPVDETQNCNDSPPEYYYLSAAQKSILPYTGYDTLHMVSNTGDTIHCIGTGKQPFNTRVFQPHSHPSCVGYGTEKFYEAYRIEFVDRVKSKKIELYHYDNYVNSIYEGLSAVSIKLNGDAGVTRDDLISKTTGYNYIGDIEIRGTIYENATRAESERTDSNRFVLINKTAGILKIQLNENEKWELLPN